MRADPMLLNPVVRFEKVDVVFGPNPKAALPMLDRGAHRDAIQEQTGNVVAVSGASLTVDEGEICVLMGLSGSGKSSLLRCVNGLNRVARGRVIVRDGERDVEVHRCDADTLRDLRMNRISMVFQQFALMPWRTVLQNVAFGLEIRGLTRQERLRHAQETLSTVGLEKWGDKYPHQLSGGMQQRVGLARALVTDADILLMDEPFSALDPLIRQHLQDELIELQRRLGKTILFVSHDFDEAIKLGSKIAIMEGGRILQVGRPEEIVLRPADAHVRRFVASMNPINVLTAVSIMTPRALLHSANGDTSTLLLDPAGHCQVRLDAAGRLTAVWLSGAAGRLLPYQPSLTLDFLTGRDVVAATPDTPMRTIVEVCHATGWPIPLVDGEGRFLGVVGEREILRGLLLRTTLPEHRAEGVV